MKAPVATRPGRWRSLIGKSIMASRCGDIDAATAGGTAHLPAWSTMPRTAARSVVPGYYGRTMDWKIELIPVPVTDADRAKAFYQKVGFNADHDYQVREGL